MPIYEYQCPKCGFVAERIEKITESNPAPICGECLTGMNKVMSNCTFHLKGSGWYVTDYKNKPNKKSTGSQ